jgi:hypothetical protein
MSSLAELNELVGFFSYSREDDEDSSGGLSALRDRIQRELRSQLGRSAKTFRLWQDKESIAWGQHWKERIEDAVAQAAFFIPIVTPTAVQSPFCLFEFNSFLAREQTLGRDDLLFPIYYIKIPKFEDSVHREGDPVLSIIAKRQYVDWRERRHGDVNSAEIKKAIGEFCAHIVETLQKPWVSLEERRATEAAGARQKDEEVQRRREADAKRREAEEEHKKAAGRERRRQEAEAKRRADEQEREEQAELEAGRRAEEEKGRAKAESKRRTEQERAFVATTPAPKSPKKTYKKDAIEEKKRETRVDSAQSDMRVQSVALFIAVILLLMLFLGVMGLVIFGMTHR